MEAVYLKGIEPHWASDLVNLEDYFWKFLKATEDVCNVGGTEISQIHLRLGLPLTGEQMQTLSETCNPDLLAIEGENPVVDVCTVYRNPGRFDKTEIPCDVNLETFNILKNRSRIQEEYINSKLKYRNRIFLSEECRKLKPDITPGKEFIVSIRLFFPFNHTSQRFDRNPVMPVCGQELTTLGNNTLADLRDVILCMEEFGDTEGDVSENPNARVNLRLKDVYKSGMFYIGNTFYIDRRYPDNIDYSEEVRTWGAKRKIVMNDVETMENTRINDLCIKFGYPYVYQHLGNCEHLVVFSDARLMHPDDVLAKQQYPLYLSFSQTRSAKSCMLCGSSIAKFIVISSSRLTRDPSYVCESCLIGYMYIDGKKIGTFKAYRFYDRRAMI